MIKFFKKLYQKVDNSELNVWGRITTVATFFILYTLINQGFCSICPEYSFLSVMLLGWLFYAFAGICLLLIGMFLVILISAFLWIPTGECDEELATYIVIAPLKALRIIFLFIYGDWDRFFWRKNEL